MKIILQFESEDETRKVYDALGVEGQASLIATYKPMASIGTSQRNTSWKV